MRVTTIYITSQSTAIGDGTDDSKLTLTAAAAKNLLGKAVYASDSTSTLLNIRIVDRTSAIANFIEEASFPGSQKSTATTGTIDFYNGTSWNSTSDTTFTTTPALSGVGNATLYPSIFFAEKFTNGPYAIQNPGDQIKVTLNVSLD